MSRHEKAGALVVAYESMRSVVFMTGTTDAADEASALPNADQGLWSRDVKPRGTTTNTGSSPHRFAPSPPYAASPRHRPAPSGSHSRHHCTPSRPKRVRNGGPETQIQVQATSRVLCRHHSPTCNMIQFNIFHILGDVSHTSSKLILIWAIHSNSSAEGGFNDPHLP